MCVKVTVVIPTHNRYSLLEKTLQSVIAQRTNFKVEVIVIDDHSAEDIYGLCKRFKCSYYCSRSKGAQFARNLGVKRAKGEYIAFMDSDDIYLNTYHLQIEADILDSNSKIVLVFTDKVHFSRDSQIHFTDNLDRIKLKPFKNPLNLLIKSDFIGSYSGVMIKKEVFVKVEGCDETLPARQDWDLWLRMSSRGMAVLCKAPLTGYRHHDNQISKTPENKITGTLAVLNKHSRLFSETITKRFWKNVHCIKIILASSLCSFDLSNCQYSQIKLITFYMNYRKHIDFIIRSNIVSKLIRIFYCKGYFFEGIFRFRLPKAN